MFLGSGYAMWPLLFYQASESELMKTDEQIIEELKRVTEKLLFMSEADYPFEVVRLESRAELSPQSLHEISGWPEDAPVKSISAEDFFRVAMSEPEWKREDQLTLARRYQALFRLLTENLSELRVHKIGSINMAVLILGRSPEGNWLGLSTRVVET